MPESRKLVKFDKHPIIIQQLSHRVGEMVYCDKENKVLLSFETGSHVVQASLKLGV